MICERILGNVGDRVELPEEVDVITFDWTEAHRRFLRKVSAGGRTVGIMLPAGSRLSDGDVLHDGPGLLVWAKQEKTQLLAVARTAGPAWGRVLYELGARHEPVEVREDLLLVPARDDLEAWLKRVGVGYVVSEELFRPEVVAGMRWTVREMSEAPAAGG